MHVSTREATTHADTKAARTVQARQQCVTCYKRKYNKTKNKNKKYKKTHKKQKHTKKETSIRAAYTHAHAQQALIQARKQHEQYKPESSIHTYVLYTSVKAASSELPRKSKKSKMKNTYSANNICMYMTHGMRI